MTDPLPLPYCPDCGYVSPIHNVGGTWEMWATGPVNWRSFHNFRCGCRIVWGAREKGLIDEACGGHGTGPWTMERLVKVRIQQSIEELKKVTQDGLWDWTPERLQRAREERSALDAKIEASRKWYEGRQYEQPL